MHHQQDRQADWACEAQFQKSLNASPATSPSRLGLQGTVSKVTHRITSNIAKQIGPARHSFKSHSPHHQQDRQADWACKAQFQKSLNASPARPPSRLGLQGTVSKVIHRTTRKTAKQIGPARHSFKSHSPHHQQDRQADWACKAQFQKSLNVSPARPPSRLGLRGTVSKVTQCITSKTAKQIGPARRSIKCFG